LVVTTRYRNTLQVIHLGDKLVINKIRLPFAFGLMTCLSLASCGKHVEQTIDTSKVAQVNNHVIATLELANPSSFERAKQATYLSYYDLGLSNKTGSPILSVKHGDKFLDVQNVDWDFDGQMDGILFLTDLSATVKQSYDITAERETPDIKGAKFTQAELSQKSGGEWVSHSKLPNSAFQEYIGGKFENVQSVTPPPQYTDHSNWIRYEGPGIESDKVGYRIYLDWRNGFDIFGKLTSAPVLQQVGLEDYEAYHHKQDWGQDILKVGNTLGAGGFGLWHNDSLSLINKTDSLTATINENGHLRSAFTIDYKGWQSEVGKQDFSATFSMLGGSRLAKVDLNFTKNVQTMAVGVVKHPDTVFIKGNTDITGKAYSYIASWGKQSLDGAFLGMAVFFKKENLNVLTEDEHNYIAVLRPQGKPTESNSQAMALDYYFAAVWQPESGIASQEAFIEYLEQEAEKLTIQPRQRLTTALSKKSTSETVNALSALAWSKALADSELKRKTLSYHYDGWDVNRQRKPKFEYDIVGLNPLAYDDLAKVTDDPAYADVLQTVTGSYINDDGSINMYDLSNYNIDSVAPGQAILRLYQNTGEPKYKFAADILRKQLATQPRTREGAFWHKKKYTGQLWLDGVYMGMPFLAQYSALFEQEQSFEEVVNEFKLTRKYLRDPKTGLYYHGWDENKQQEWADKETGLSPMFWGRGVGWLALALVDVLDYLPEDDKQQRAVLIDMINELAESLITFQDQQTHTWWQIMDQPQGIGNYRESSASAMFTYFFTKAVNKGYLSASYRQVALDAYQGLLNEFILVHFDGSISMTNQCYVAGLGFGRNGSYHYYMSEPVSTNDLKGNFVFMLVGLEIAKMLGH
jgi:unsaturated rhamnogalacturonyl hydrolase